MPQTVSTNGIFNALTRGIYNAAKFIAFNPLKSLTLALYAQTTMINAHKLDPLAMAAQDFQNNFCPMSTASFAPLPFASSYDVLSNVNNVHEAEYIFIGETHNNQTHHFIETQLVAALAPEGGQIYFEGWPYGAVVPCEAYCRKTTGFGFVDSDHDRTACDPNIRYASKNICDGWESYENKNRMEKIAAYITLVESSKERELYSKAKDDWKALMQGEIKGDNNKLLTLKDTVNFIKHIYKHNISPELFREMKPALNKLTNKIATLSKAINAKAYLDLVKEVGAHWQEALIAKQAYHAHLMNPEFIIKKRNEGMVHIIKQNDDPKVKKFFIAGKGHFFKQVQGKIVFDLSESPAQAELHDAVKNKKHAFLILKPNR